MSEANITIGAMGGRRAGDTLPAADHARTNRLVEVMRWICSFPAMLGGLLVAGAFAMGRVARLDPDAWWHIKTGELILSTHRWATTDPYSYTSAGAPWISCEWLGDVFMAVIYRLGGLRGLETFLIVMAGTVILGIYGFATLRSGNCKAAFLTSIVLLPLVIPSFNLRPQMLGYLFLVLTLIAMERFRQGKQRAVWLLPLLFLIWINTHGSWIIGLGAVGLYIACGLVSFQIGGLEARRWTNSERIRLETVFMLSLAAIPITPYGVKLAAYPFQLVSSYPLAVATVQEWRVMPFDVNGGKIFLALVLGFFVAQAAFRFSWHLEEFLLFLFGVAMACLHVRFLLLFVPFFAPLGAVILARWAPPYMKEKDPYLVNFALMAGMVIAMVHYFPSKAQMEDKVANQFPVHALEYMRGHSVPGPLFNNYGFGGYLIDSGYKTFIDGRGELFEATGVLRDYLYLTQLKPGALTVLSRYGIRSCLLLRDEPLAVVLASQPDWQKVYSDNVSALYVKRGAVNDSRQALVEFLPATAR